MFSKRIKTIASLVEPEKPVIDVGCDHALLDIYLTLYNQNSCIATDINSKAIEIARKNIQKYQLNIKTYVCDGLQNIPISEGTNCIIAGMGTNTILHILKSTDLDNINYFIIQTNNNYYELRKFMSSVGYYIIDEIALKDKKIWYVIIKFSKGKRNYKKIEYLLGPILMQKKDSQTIEYFETLKKEYEEILHHLPKKYFIKKLYIKRINSILKRLLK